MKVGDRTNVDKLGDVTSSQGVVTSDGDLLAASKRVEPNRRTYVEVLRSPSSSPLGDYAQSHTEMNSGQRSTVVNADPISPLFIDSETKSEDEKPKKKKSKDRNAKQKKSKGDEAKLKKANDRVAKPKESKGSKAKQNKDKDSPNNGSSSDKDDESWQEGKGRQPYSHTQSSDESTGSFPYTDSYSISSEKTKKHNGVNRGKKGRKRKWPKEVSSKTFSNG